MLILPQKVEIELTSNTIKYYEEKGYEIPRSLNKYNKLKFVRGTKIWVDILDLPLHSGVKVLVKCDYCGKEVPKIYSNYFNEHNKIINKDCCLDCIPIKQKESNLINYGVENISSLEVIINKRKETNLGRFGYDNPLKSPEIQEKRINTLLINYGVTNPQKSEEIRNKTISTLYKKYSVENLMYSEYIKTKLQNSVFKKYGYKNVLQVPSIREKIAKTLYKNNNVPTSSQQYAIYNLLNDKYSVILNYPLSRLNLDIALFLDNIRIDIEYDGWYWHKDKLNKDYARDVFVKSQGWKVLRIKSRCNIPTLEQLEEAINKLINSDRTFTQILLDDWKQQLNKNIRQANNLSFLFEKERQEDLVICQQ